jgi:hypothetical protein
MHVRQERSHNWNISYVYKLPNLFSTYACAYLCDAYSEFLIGNTKGDIGYAWVPFTATRKKENRRQRLQNIEIFFNYLQKSYTKQIEKTVHGLFPCFVFD